MTLVQYVSIHGKWFWIFSKSLESSLLPLHSSLKENKKQNSRSKSPNTTKKKKKKKNTLGPVLEDRWKYTQNLL